MNCFAISMLKQLLTNIYISFLGGSFLLCLHFVIYLCAERNMKCKVLHVLFIEIYLAGVSVDGVQVGELTSGMGSTMKR